MMTREITIHNSASELHRVACFVEDIGNELGLDGELQMNLNLVLEEMLSNVIRYGQSQQADDSIALKAESNGKEITLTLSDHGIEFDPTAKGDLDTDVNPAERQLGGMGIFIVKNIMDQVTYQRLNGMNVVVMKKKL
jgi:serine/threonine-protein kinase RsbW